MRSHEHKCEAERENVFQKFHELGNSRKDIRERSYWRMNRLRIGLIPWVQKMGICLFNQSFRDKNTYEFKKTKKPLSMRSIDLKKKKTHKNYFCFPMIILYYDIKN